MSSNISTNSSYYEDIPSLDTIEYELFMSRDIPAVVFLSILSIIGVIGNIHTLLVYAVSQKLAKLPVRVFILWLSAVDMIACIACMPFEICDIRFSFTFSSAGACKFFKYLNKIVTLASVGFLTVIAIQRLQISGKRLPRTRGYSNVALNIISMIIVGMATALSIPVFLGYGLGKKETTFPQRVGSRCVVSSEYQDKNVAWVYTVVFILFCTACCIICVVCYGIILHVISAQVKKKTKHRNPKENKMNMFPAIHSRDTEEVSVDQAFDSPENTDFAQKHNIHVSQQKIKSHERTGYEKGQQLTISLIIATAVSYIAYMIYLGIILVNLTNPILINESVRPASRVLFRTYFINNSINPIVFCLLDNTFRKECVNLYSKTICVNRLRKA